MKIRFGKILQPLINLVIPLNEKEEIQELGSGGSLFNIEWRECHINGKNIIKTTMATQQDVGQENPCTHHGNKRDSGPEEKSEAKVEEGKVRIYPNPAQDELKIEGVSLLEPDIKVKLLNMQGQQLKVPLFIKETNAVSLKGLPSGMYIIEIRCEGMFSVQKFIKQ